MSKLDNVRIFNSPITNESYLCSVNSKNIITDKLKLDEDKMMEFMFGIVETLEKSYGSDIKLEDDRKIINIEVVYKRKLYHCNDIERRKYDYERAIRRVNRAMCDYLYNIWWLYK